MAFKAYGVNSGGASTSNNYEVYDKMNEYTVEAAGLQKKKVLPGYISMIVDLGMQKQDDAKFEFKGTDAEREEQEAKFKAENKDTYFEYDANTRKWYKRWPQRPIQEVAMAVDFPSIKLDKGQFFRKENEPEELLPLRLWLGGEFYYKSVGKKLISFPFVLNEFQKDGVVSMSHNGTVYKMASAAGLVEDGEPFRCMQIGQLLGKSMLFEVQVFFKAGKDDRKFYTEYVKFASALPEVVPSPEVVTPLHSVSFHEPNEPQALKEIRRHVRNKMELAEDYDQSIIKHEFEALYEKKTEEATVPSDDIEEDLPF